MVGYTVPRLNYAYNSFAICLACASYSRHTKTLVCAQHTAEVSTVEQQHQGARAYSYLGLRIHLHEHPRLLTTNPAQCVLFLHGDLLKATGNNGVETTHGQDWQASGSGLPQRKSHYRICVRIVFLQLLQLLLA